VVPTAATLARVLVAVPEAEVEVEVVEDHPEPITIVS
jgi:hypothetical protein